ncbi:MAG TPA: hypothetical protein PKG48_12875 [Bacteroidales bacterium]|nr:hypothetical protein [Bacteroidales bacterium]
MTTVKEGFLSRWIPGLAVLLAALDPILALYAHNADQVILGQLVQPVLFALLLGAMLLVAAWAAVRKYQDAAILAVIFLLLFWNYGWIYRGVTSVIHLQHWHILPVILVLYAHLAYLIIRRGSPKARRNILLILFVPLATLLVFNVINVTSAEIRKMNVGGHSGKAGKSNTGNMAVKNLPDIYLIILDEGANYETIGEEWGVDPNGLVDSWKKEGFFVAGNSQARYNQTTWNMPSLLNLEYLTGPVSKPAFIDYYYDPQKSYSTPEYKLLHKIDYNRQIKLFTDNLLMQLLHDKGYKIEVMEGLSQHYTGLKFSLADEKFSYQDASGKGSTGHLFNDFDKELLQVSMVSAVMMFMEIDQSCNVNYSATKYILQSLEKDPYKLRSPKFVYAHIMCPHIPYVFDRDGRYVEGPTADAQRKAGFVQADNTVNKAYLEQYIYITNEIRRIAVEIAGRKNPAGNVIIIQSDHGPRPHEVYLKNKENSFHVFNMVYFPDRDYSRLYDSIAPLNTLRVALNKYLGTRYEMLEDR